MEKKRYDGIAIEPVYLDGEEVIVTSGCVSTFDVNAEGVEPSMDDTVNTADVTDPDILRWIDSLDIAPGFYTVKQISDLDNRPQ